jgi:hypothetical protein
MAFSGDCGLLLRESAVVIRGEVVATTRYPERILLAGIFFKKITLFCIWQRMPGSPPGSTYIFQPKKTNMKKNWVLMAVLGIVISQSSCKSSSSSSFEKDVRKMADYRCQEQKLKAKDQSDEKVKKEMETLEKEMDEFGNKMEVKYKDKKDDSTMNAKAEMIMKEEMDKCK